MKSVFTHKDFSIPKLGFGTWKLSGEQAVESTLKALEVGFRLLDTADAYGNHVEVGKAIKNSGISRNEIFLTTKVWHSDLKPEDVKKCADRFLEELQTEYIDLLLIHWPNRNIPLNETLEAMDQLKEKGVIRNIGVSNFTINHLKDCLKTFVEVVNNQIELSRLDKLQQLLQIMIH